MNSHFYRICEQDQSETRKCKHHWFNIQQSDNAGWTIDVGIGDIRFVSTQLNGEYDKYTMNNMRKMYE